MREIMTAAELATYHMADAARSPMSDDGYDDMELAERAGWTTRYSWGEQGWNLGNHPYVIIQIRNRTGNRFEMQSICEGDHSVYRFPSDLERERAINYLFLWYQVHGDLEDELTFTREQLDAGEVEVDRKYLGPSRVFQKGEADAD